MSIAKFVVQRHAHRHRDLTFRWGEIKMKFVVLLLTVKVNREGDLNDDNRFGNVDDSVN